MLPTIVEYLSATGLVRPGRTQYYFPMLPAGLQLNLSILPPFGVFAAVKYGFAYDVVPGTFDLELSQAGNKYVEGTVEEDLTREIIPYWILYTTAEPLLMQITNISPLAQTYRGTQFVILIDTEVVLAQVKAEVAALSLSENIRLAKEANALLTAILQALPGQPVPGEPLPRPPVTRGVS